jgi:hypothetical protein
MTRRCDHPPLKPPPGPDAPRRLALALQAADMAKRERTLSIRFDTVSDSDTAYQVLRATRDSYDPK